MAEPRPQPDKITAPEVNFSRGLRTVEIPELGVKSSGKVRDWWDVPGTDLRVFVTTDRQSAFDRVVATIPDKGKVLNLTTDWWADFLAEYDIVESDIVAVPHPNVKVAREAVEVIPVEMVFRRFMAKSSTSTSVYRNYSEGRRNIYGIEFPDGLEPNQAFPEKVGRHGVVFTPTTKAAEGEHDAEITEEAAREIIATKYSRVMSDRVIEAGYSLFEYGQKTHLINGLLLADTKYEFGIDKYGRLMLIDEVHTPDSSRIWKAENYLRLIQEGQNPEGFDKEILRRWLSEQNFSGNGSIPIIPEAVIESMREAYVVPYNMIADNNISDWNVPSDPTTIRNAVLQYLATA